MRTSEEITEVIKSIIQVQSSLKKIKKDRVNPFAESKYATLDAILEEVLPMLTENKLALTQEPLTIHEENAVKIGCRTTLFHESGQFIEYEPLLFSFEKGSKMNMAQSSGSIITYSKRYSLSAILGISTGDDTDGVDPSARQNNNEQNKNQNYKQQKENNYSNNSNHKQDSEAENERKLIQEIMKYKNFLINNGKNIDELNAYIARKEGVSDIGAVDNVRILGFFKLLALKLEKKLKEAEQQTMTQTQIEGIAPVKWGE